jgi:hypothetical protein
MAVLGAPSGGSRWAQDPEALLISTLEVARDDPRLFDEVLDWLIRRVDRQHSAPAEPVRGAGGRTSRKRDPHVAFTPTSAQSFDELDARRAPTRPRAAVSRAVCVRPKPRPGVPGARPAPPRGEATGNRGSPTSQARSTSRFVAVTCWEWAHARRPRVSFSPQTYRRPRSRRSRRLPATPSATFRERWLRCTPLARLRWSRSDRTSDTVCPRSLGPLAATRRR